jgi:hypothetical protein
MHCITPELLCLFKITLRFQHFGEDKSCPQLRTDVNRRNLEDLERLSEDSPSTKKSVTRRSLPRIALRRAFKISTPHHDDTEFVAREARFVVMWHF